MHRKTLVKRMLAGYFCLVLLPMLVMGSWFILRIHDTYARMRMQDIKSWAQSGAASVGNNLAMLSEHAAFAQNYGGIVDFLEDGPYGTAEQLELWFSDIQRLYSYLRYANSYVNKVVIYTTNDKILNLGDFLIYLPDNEQRIRTSKEGWSYDIDAGHLIYRKIIYDMEFKQSVALFELDCSGDLLRDSFVTGMMDDAVYFLKDGMCFRLGDMEFFEGAGTDRLTSVAYIEELDMEVMIDAEKCRAGEDVKSYALLLVVLVSSILCSCLYFIFIYRFSKRIHRFASHIASSDATLLYEDNGHDEISSLVYEYNHMLTTNEQMLRQVEIAELRQREADYRALQSQINPHFINNTLETARMAAELNDTETTERILCALGQQLRYTLAKDAEQVTLADEMENVRKYLYILKQRMDSRLNVTVEMDRSLDNIRCPRFMIQPLVENAVLHGIEPNPEGGHINISVSGENGWVNLRIENDGVGVSHERLEELRTGLNNCSVLADGASKFNGVGMNNVYQRMKYLYKDSFKMHLDSPSGKGFCVSMAWKGVRRREDVDCG